MGSLIGRHKIFRGFGYVLVFSFTMGLISAHGTAFDSAMAKMDPPKTKVTPPGRLPQGTNCYRSAGHWTCTAPDGSLWTCNSNANGTMNTGDCACVSGCKKPQPTPSPTPTPTPTPPPPPKPR